jgi:hypothetical protein
MCFEMTEGARNIFAFFFPRRHLGTLMTDNNLNFWGWLVVPVGVTICFGMGLLVWLRDELRADSGDEQEKPR